MFCSNCGQTIPDGSKFCPNCGKVFADAPPVDLNKGEPYTSPPQSGYAPPPSDVPPSAGPAAPLPPGGQKLIYPGPNPRDPVMMGLLGGCCLPGLAQILVGQVSKGVVMLIVWVTLGWGVGIFTGFVSLLAVHLLAGIDAYLIAKKLQAGQAVGEWEFF